MNRNPPKFNEWTFFISAVDFRPNTSAICARHDDWEECSADSHQTAVLFQTHLPCGSRNIPNFRNMADTLSDKIDGISDNDVKDVFISFVADGYVWGE